MTYSLMYSSQATRDISDQDLVEILEVACCKNDTHEITGMLLYQDGTFIQVLEGPQKAIEDLYAHISKDSRHTNIELLWSGEIDKRQFGSWSMGLLSPSITDLEKFPDFNQMVNEMSANPARGRQAAGDMMSMFSSMSLRSA